MSDWNEERKQQVASLLRQGKGYTLIARELGVSRGSVAGIVFRTKELKEIERPVKPKKVNVEKKADRKVKPRNYGIKAIPTTSDAAVMVGRPLALLGRRNCWWPANDATKGEMHLFCGAPVDFGQSFCPRHYSLVYREEKS